MNREVGPAAQQATSPGAPGPPNILCSSTSTTSAWASWAATAAASCAAQPQRGRPLRQRGAATPQFRARSPVHADPLGPADRALRHPLRQLARCNWPGVPGGLVAWEQTMGDVLSAAGYATAIYGKWHIGDEPGRYPTDHGFDEWYGIPHSYDECLWPDDPLYDPDRDPMSFVVESAKGGPVENLEQLTLEVRRDIDREYLTRADAFHPAQRRRRHTVLRLLQSLDAASADRAARRVQGQKRCRRLGRLPAGDGCRFRDTARSAR